MKKKLKIFSLFPIIFFAFFYIFKIYCKENLISINGVKLGMTAKDVVNVLGKNYELINTIEKSAFNGQDYCLVYGDRENKVELVFVFGRLSSVLGYSLSTSKGVISKNDSLNRMYFVLGYPLDKSENGSKLNCSYKYLQNKSHIIVSTKNEKIENFTLESW